MNNYYLFPSVQSSYLMTPQLDIPTVSTLQFHYPSTWWTKPTSVDAYLKLNAGNITYVNFTQVFKLSQLDRCFYPKALNNTDDGGIVLGDWTCIR